MSGVIATIPKFQFSNAAGAPLVGGKLNTYLAGGTTPASTWQDESLTSLNTNPITLDSRGECVVWLDSTKKYKFVLTDAALNPVWTVDNVNNLTNALAASGGSDTIGFVQAGTGAVARTVQSKLRESVSVKDFGATGDGATDDTVAIQLAITYALTASLAGAVNNPMLAIYFPAGVYIVDSNVLGGSLSRAVSGALFYGDGFSTSVLRFKPALGATSYMLDNTDELQFADFENLGFEGTTPVLYNAGTIQANANFMRQSSTGYSQGLRFLNCRISGFQKVLVCDGSNTASENKFLNCRITHIAEYVLGLNNLQSVNHNFVGTDIEVILGNIFQINASGGGSITVNGGSIIPQSTGSVVKLNGNTTGIISMQGVRIEMRESSKLFDGSADRYLCNFSISDSTIYMTEATSTKEIVSILAYQTVSFDGCIFDTNGQVATFKFYDTTDKGNSGLLSFDNCTLPDGITDQITFAGYYGHATARNCKDVRYGAIATEPFLYAVDFDLGALDFSYAFSGGGSPNFQLKKVWLKNPFTVWPISDGAGGSLNDLTVKLPRGSVITRIVLRKFAAGGSVDTYTLRVTNNDKTLVHATSNTAQQADAHSITLDDYYYPVGATTNERIIRVCVTAGTTGTAVMGPGFGFIEYI